jgi:RNA-directed DNA polymerase
MKRIGNLYKDICSIENLNLADAIARKGKSKQYGIQAHDLNREANIQALHESLINKTYRTSVYTTFKVYEPKEREVYRLPYFPDRIAHHAVMNVLEPIFCSTFTSDSYSCIKGKGIHGAARGVKQALQNVTGTTYCLKLDIKKFYPSIDHAILKALLRRKFKDHDLLWLLDEIIDSADGVPIGNYLSQYFANFYLTYFDHWLKEVKQVRYYFRYADDLVILHNEKSYLHTLLNEISSYLNDKLNLTVKKNYQVFPVESRGIDFVGYRFYHSHTLLRKSIKQNFARMIARRPNRMSIASYYGWCVHADCGHLIKTLLSNERIQGLSNNYLPKILYWRQNKDRPDTKPGDRCT